MICHSSRPRVVLIPLLLAFVGHIVPALAQAEAVDIAPVSANLSPLQTVQFSASTTGLSDPSILWLIDPQVGDISSAGLYTAPPSVSAPMTVNILALALHGRTMGIGTVTIEPRFAGSTRAASEFYVSSTSGNDDWSGRLPAPNSSYTDGPFRSLEQAQIAMEFSLIKTTLVRDGKYPLAPVWWLNPADSGENWFAYPGENPVIDGGGRGTVSLAQGGPSNIAIEGFTFLNLGPGGIAINGTDSVGLRWNHFLNCSFSCINGGHVTNADIESNTMDGVAPGQTPGGGSNAAINFWFGSSNNRIAHNLIQNSEGGGVAFSSGPNDPPNSNNHIDRNIFRNVDYNVVDYGAIYFYDKTHAGTGNQITNNLVDGNTGSGPLPNITRAFYLDALASNVLISGNICRSCGRWAWQIHGGDHNVIQNNIFDLSLPGTQLGLYQTNSDTAQFGMEGNVFSDNIVYFSGVAPDSLYQVNMDWPDPVTFSASNLYFSGAGAWIPNGDVIVDQSPVFANPYFADSAHANYWMPDWSPAYSTIHFQPVPTDQGPLPRQ